MLVRTAAVQRNGSKTFVYLVKPDHSVTVREVSIGTANAEESEITSELPRGTCWSRREWTSCRKAAWYKHKLSSLEAPPRPQDPRPTLYRSIGTTRMLLRSPARAIVMNPSRIFYFASDRHIPTDVRHSVGGRGLRLSSSRSRPAGNRLPHHSGGDPYPGASPDVVASSVTAPLERQFGQMPGLKQMSSTSSTGSSSSSCNSI